MAHEGSGEAPRRGIKRKFDGEPKNLDEGNAGVPAARVSSCISMRPPPIDTTQPVAQDVANRSFEMFKKPRMEAAGKGQMNPVRTTGDGNFKCFNDEPAEKTRPVLPERGVTVCRGGVSNRPREIDVPNEKASAGGAAAGGRSDFGLKMRHDKGYMTLNLTEELLRFLHQDSKTNFSIKVESRESGVFYLLTWNGISDCE